MNKLPDLEIGDLKFNPPFILGGMGVGLSNSSLAAACAETGMGGTIAAGGLCGSGYQEQDYVNRSNEALVSEIKKARDISNGKGHIGVNCMVALTNYDELVKTASSENVDYIISGAGLPLNLPELVDNDNIKLLPVVSSGKAAEIICRRWQTKYQRLPDAVIVEGALAGGHLGVKQEDIPNWNANTLIEVSKEVIEVVKKYETGEHKIPVIAAGGLFDGHEIADIMNAGVKGVQLATRFLATHECPLGDDAKQAIVDSKKEDMILIKSPVGMPGRALKNNFIERVLEGKTMPANCFYHCLKTCDPKTTPYCIASALFNAVENRFKNSLIMVGINAYRINKVVSVKELVDELINETIEGFQKLLPISLA